MDDSDQHSDDCLICEVFQDMQEGSVDLGRDPATPRQVGDDDDYSDGDDDGDEDGGDGDW